MGAGAGQGRADEQRRYWASFWKSCAFGDVAPDSPLRGYVGAEHLRPRASARGYTRPQLRSSFQESRHRGNATFSLVLWAEPFAKFGRVRDLLPGRVVPPGSAGGTPALPGGIPRPGPVLSARRGTARAPGGNPVTARWRLRMARDRPRSRGESHGQPSAKPRWRLTQVAPNMNRWTAPSPILLDSGRCWI